MKGRRFSPSKQLWMALLLTLPILSSYSQFVSYSEDLELLKSHAEVIELQGDNASSRIAVVPRFQGKVMTSTLDGPEGKSLGWINREPLMDGSQPTGGELGGEDRLWIGPLGGQYSFYYQQIKPLNESNWKVPASMNDEPYEIVQSDSDFVSLRKQMQLTNFIGTSFKIDVSRKIKLLNRDTIEEHLDIDTSGLSVVAFETTSEMINADSTPWKKEMGLPSLWHLGMFPGTDKGLIIIPIRKGVTRSDIREYLSTTENNKIRFKEGRLLYRADGKFRNKIGIPAHLCGKTWGSYHPESGVLTLVEYQFDGPDGLFFDSNATVQNNPYEGDPVQIYNNGPMDLSIGEENSFYEMETASSARELAPGESIKHWHRIYHLGGDKDRIRRLMERVLD